MRIAVALFLIAAPCASAASPPAPWKLTAEGRKFLDGLFAFLVSPAGAERVAVRVLERTEVRTTFTEERHAWRVGVAANGAARHVGPDGHPLVTRGKARPADFHKECRALLAVKDRAPPLDRVAWLYRLGHEALAARLLARIKDRDEAVKELRAGLAWDAYGSMVHAYMARADAEALAHGERLLRLYADVAREEYKLGPAIVEDLKRRKKAGTFGTKREIKPKGFDGWPVKRRVAHLIDCLDDANPVQWSQPGWPSFGDDARVEALVEIGEPAVPALIDCLEKDNRLTRAVGYSRAWFRDRTVLPARKAALAALMLILRVEAFLGSPGAEGNGKAATATLRAYWKRYGKLPIHLRLLAHLTDRGASPEAWLEAAQGLAKLGSPSERIWFGESGFRGRAMPRRRNPVLDLDGPVAVDAILEAMGRHLVADAANPDLTSLFRDTRQSYLSALANLGDRRAIPILRRRLRKADVVERRHLVHACRELGDGGPVDAYAKDFEAGKLVLPAGDDGKKEFSEAVRVLVYARRPACGRALMAMVRPGHWAHAPARDRVLHDRGFQGDHWHSHPFCVLFLAGELDNLAGTDIEYEIKDNTLRRSGPGSLGIGPIPRCLANPANRLETVKLRRCDEVAELLSGWVVGVPEFHPLLKDADARRAALRRFVALYRGRLRRPTKAEVAALGAESWASFLPDIRPLGRPATEADVKAGRAVFHLGGKGKLSKRKLPAVAVMKGEKGLIVQAEVGADGKEVFGVVMRHAIRRIKSTEAKSVTPLVEAAGQGSRGLASMKSFSIKTALASYLVWEANALRPRKPAPRDEEIWANLGAAKPKEALAAMEALVDSPARAVRLLGAKLSPVPHAPVGRVAGLIRQLGSDEYETRIRAEASLEKMVIQVEGELREAMAKATLEQRLRIKRLLLPLDRKDEDPAWLRQVRAIEVLERIGTPAAVKLLRKLAGGARGAALTWEARLALERLGRSEL